MDFFDAMFILETIMKPSQAQLAEHARQLRSPEGAAGLSIAIGLVDQNKAGTHRLVEQLAIQPGDSVLEIGFGVGRAASAVVEKASGALYTGVDQSPTMLEEAMKYNAALVAGGRATFVLASAETLPFADDSFDKAFSIGVLHFFEKPIPSLSEICRVLRPGGIMVSGCLGVGHSPPFAREEFGFYLRDAATWEQICLESGFSACETRDLSIETEGSSGEPTSLSLVSLRARK